MEWAEWVAWAACTAEAMAACTAMATRKFFLTIRHESAHLPSANQVLLDVQLLWWQKEGSRIRTSECAVNFVDLTYHSARHERKLKNSSKLTPNMRFVRKFSK